MNILSTLPTTKRAYSYIRFSRAHQADGDSLRRQEAATKKYCESLGYTLDKSLELEDLGISAFRGKNAKAGALSRFIHACERGLVPRGSALIVESLDRLSRQKPRRTQSLLTELLDEHQIEIHLTMVRKVLRPETDDAMDMMYTVALASRANEESETKSMRILEALRERRAKAAAGEAVLIHPVIPWWLERGKGDKLFFCPPEREAVVKRIFELAAGGWSTPQIARKLKQEKIPTWRVDTRIKDCKKEPNPNRGQPLLWESVYVRKMLASEAAQGHVSPLGKVGRTTTVLNYYPRIVSDELAAEARAAQSRLAKSSKGRLPRGIRPTNLFRNLLRFKGHWVRHGSVTNRRLDANGNKTYAGNYECVDTSDTGKLLFFFPARQLEPILLAALSELQPEDLRAPETDTKPLRSVSIKPQVAKLEAKAENLLAAVESGSVTVANRLKQVEDELAAKRQELAAVLIEETVPTDNSNRAELGQIKALTYNLKDNVTREKIAAALCRIISRIDVARLMRDLPMSTKERGGMIKKISEQAPETIKDVTPTARGRKPLYLYVSFVGGGKRLIVRDENILPKSFIASVRVEPAT